MALARHVFCTLIKTCVAEGYGRISAVKKLIYGLSLFKSGKRTVLPENGSRVRKSALKSVMAAHKSSVAKVKSLIKNLPELIHVPARGAGNIHKVYGYDTLVESSVVLRLALIVYIWGKEAAAAHTGIAVSLAVFIFLELKHDFFGDIIRHHAFCGTFCGKLCEVEVF